MRAGRPHIAAGGAGGTGAATVTSRAGKAGGLLVEVDYVLRLDARITWSTNRLGAEYAFSISSIGWRPMLGSGLEDRLDAGDDRLDRLDFRLLPILTHGLKYRIYCVPCSYRTAGEDALDLVGGFCSRLFYRLQTDYTEECEDLPNCKL